MSDFHQQAIEDVARATNWSSDDIKLFIAQAETGYDRGSDKAFAYAVAQQERVLELEAKLQGIMQIHEHEREANGFSECYDLAAASLKGLL